MASKYCAKTTSNKGEEHLSFGFGAAYIWDFMVFLAVWLMKVIISLDNGLVLNRWGLRWHTVYTVYNVILSQIFWSTTMYMFGQGHLSVYISVTVPHCIREKWQILKNPDTRFMWPTWRPPGAGRTQVGPMLATWILLSGKRLLHFRGPDFQVKRFMFAIVRTLYSLYS